MRGTAPLVISALISVITPVASRVKTYYIQGTVETLQLLRFQKPSTERHDTSVLVWVGFAKKNRGFGTDCDNRNKTNVMVP